MTSEERALKIVCPLCRAGVGERCLRQGKSPIRLRTAHPHRERRVKAAMTVIDGS